MTAIDTELALDDDLDEQDDAQQRWDDVGGALFPGDTGTLTLSQRNVMWALLKRRYISAETNPKEWAALMADRRLYVSRLNDLFLELHINDTEQVAYKRQAAPDSGPSFPTLLYNVAYSYEETALLVFLRQRDRSARASGDLAAFVDRETLLAHLENFAPPGHTDMGGWRRRSENAVEKLYKAGILLSAADKERYKIAPVLAALLPLPALQELQEQLEQRIDNSDTTTADESGDEA